MSGAASLYPLLRPLLFALDPETAHHWTLRGACTLGGIPGLARAIGSLSPVAMPRLQQSLFGLTFANPVGLAAGFDKDGVLAGVLPRLGFGFIELGSVTPRPQPGNPRPRLFRLRDDAAVINRMGFNNEGAAAMAGRLAQLTARPIPIGVNLGKNKDTPLERASDDYCAALRAVYDVADYAVINVSSPNTPGLRDLQHRDQLRALIAAVGAERTGLAVTAGRRLPILVKVAPELTEAEQADVVEAAFESGMDGLIATNTTVVRAGLRSPHASETGGLSGHPLHTLSVQAVARLRRLSGGKLPLIGVGGIFSAADAYDFIRAGAHLVQLYTGLVYEGPGLVRVVARGLDALLQRDGFRSIGDAVGSAG
ncbi:MAG TPA: quinone-dependent dihydroorotate dehydrogenase [bacterium]